MSRDPLSLTIPDVSAFAKSLRAGLDTPPGHAQMLGLIARAAGFRNYQHMRARLAETPAPVVDDRQVSRAMRFFRDGQLAAWPSRTQVQKLCLWAVWAAIPNGVEMTERAISDVINEACIIQDAAQIRRAMVEHQMLKRDKAGRAYLRIEQKPPAEAVQLIARLSG